MHATDVVLRLEGMGIVVHRTDDGKILAGPKTTLTEEARRLIRFHKPQLLEQLAQRPRLFYEQVLGHRERAYAVLTRQQRVRAQQLGLLPAGIAESSAAVVAYRNDAAQCLFAMPNDPDLPSKIQQLFEAS